MKKAIVAGSIALDITLMMNSNGHRPINTIFSQGKITNISGVEMYLGGETGNTGIAMSKMGVPVTIVCKVGDDRAGNIVQGMFNEYPTDSKIIVMEDYNTTVAVALTPPGMDKISFLSKGAGQTFQWKDVPQESLRDADLFHFGYPTAMDLLYIDEGAEFLKIFSEAKKFGITTSVDTTLPDLGSDAGKQDWNRILSRVLPFVDIFMPSIEETLFMLDRSKYVELVSKIGDKNLIDYIDPNSIVDIGDTLLSMGPKIVMIKMGKQGLYLRTAGKEAFDSFGRGFPENCDEWFGRELWDPAFNTNPILSTTGAGDTAIAGFLSSFLRGDPPEKALEIASLSASLCISSYDTVSNIGKLSELDALLANEFGRLDIKLNNDCWKRKGYNPLYYSIRDKNKNAVV